MDLWRKESTIFNIKKKIKQYSECCLVWRVKTLASEVGPVVTSMIISSVTLTTRGCFHILIDISSPTLTVVFRINWENVWLSLQSSPKMCWFPIPPLSSIIVESHSKCHGITCKRATTTKQGGGMFAVSSQMSWRMLRILPENIDGGWKDERWRKHKRLIFPGAMGWNYAKYIQKLYIWVLEVLNWDLGGWQIKVPQLVCGKGEACHRSSDSTSEASLQWEMGTTKFL